MRYSVSDTAEWGDYVAGPKVINAESKQAMKDLLADIQSGKFADEWVKENENGRPKMDAIRASEQAHPIEEVGRKLRGMMPFIKAK